MSPLHPLAKRSTVSILEVAKEPFVFREEGSGTRQMIEKFLAKYGIHPQNLKISSIMGSIESIKGAVEEEDGVSIISKWAVKKESKQGRLKTATFKEKFARDFSVLYRRSNNLSFSLDKFLEFLKKYPFNKQLNAYR
jgi:DNA-binding transcriptional LysR family regulator